MPRQSKSIPVYTKHRASGQAVVRLNGRDFYLGPHGTKASHLEYDRLIGEWLERGRMPGVNADAGLTVVELIARYWHHVRLHYVKNGKATGEQGAIRAGLRFLKDLYGNTPAAEFSPIALKAVRAKMIDGGLARGTINQNIGRIRRMFRWAAGEQLIPAAVWQTLVVVDGLRAGRTIARETEPIGPADGKLVDAALVHLPDVIADMVRVQQLTGMRPNEVCAIRPGDIDRAGEVWEYRPRSHKTEHRGHKRVIFIGPQAQAILLRYLARDPETYCFRPVDSEATRLAVRNANRRTPLSCGNTRGTNRKCKPKRCAGDQYTTESYARAIARACIKAFPVPGDIADDPQAAKAWQAKHHWSPNQLRHSAATEIRKRFGLEAAQVCLGHSKADVTQVYAERDFTLAANVARQIG